MAWGNVLMPWITLGMLNIVIVKMGIELQYFFVTD